MEEMEERWDNVKDEMFSNQNREIAHMNSQQF